MAGQVALVTGEVRYVAGGQQRYGLDQALLDASFERPTRSSDGTPEA